MRLQKGNKTDRDTVYLCQVGPHVSCGACCGLYNVAEPSRKQLEAMLNRRTKWFEDVQRSVEGIDEFKKEVETAEPQERPFPRFHHCPYLGMIEDTGRRVGCLLHPFAKGNNGVDFRGMSYYGGMACRTYFCPSVRELKARWLTAIRQSMNHWYQLGLIVTEKNLLASFFTEIEDRLQRPIRNEDFSCGTDAARLLRSLANLKLEWPFRRTKAPIGCHYFFEDGLYQRRQDIFGEKELPISPFEDIFVELDSKLSSADELKSAEEIIESIVARLIDCLTC